MTTRDRAQRIIATALLLAVPSAASALLIDDFEGYTPGDLQTVGAPTWTVENTGDSTVVDDGTNQYLTFGGTGDWRHFYRESDAAIVTTGQFSFRIFAEGEALDQAFGMVGEPEGTDGVIDWYGDFGPYVRVTDDTAAGAGVYSLDVRDGGGFVDDIATLNVGEWYDITLDIDTANGGTFDVLVNNSSVYSGALFRRAYVSPLNNILLMGGNGIAQNLRIDDLTTDGIVLLDGDVDGNGTVDLMDYGIIRDNFQLQVSGRGFGDLDLNGVVNLNDFLEWRANYPFPTNGLTIPEPASLGLAAALACVCASSCRRRG